MHRLHSEETLSIRPHFDTPNLRLVVDSIIDGKTPAIVWADDLATPKTVLAWEGRCIYLVGDFEDAEVNKGLRAIFSTEIQPEGQSRKLGFFKLYYSPDAWSLRLEEIFGSLLDNDVERRIYCSVQDNSSRIAVPSPPLELRQINANCSKVTLRTLAWSKMRSSEAGHPLKHSSTRDSALRCLMGLQLSVGVQQNT